MLNFKLLLPKSLRCLCCKETTKDRIFTQGYGKLKKEIEIQTILKTLRVVKAATKRNFTEVEWKKFKENNNMRKLRLTGMKEISIFKKEEPNDLKLK